ncbi:MAG TPA: hypothetical protein VGI80_09760 [Pyrinomonadaceae bacterium]
MANEVVEVHGKEVVVREDTAKAYRGIRWAIISIIVFAAIVAILFFAGLLTTMKNGGPKSPVQTEQSTQ